jgi:hypothetical protein
VRLSREGLGLGWSGRGGHGEVRRGMMSSGTV